MTADEQGADEARLRDLAELVYEVLTLAGFVPHHANMAEQQPGPVVDVDTYGGGAGVYVGWNASENLTDAASRALRGRKLDDPALGLFRNTATNMFKVITDVLTTAGFQVAEDAGDYRDLQVKVEGVLGDRVDVLTRL